MRQITTWFSASLREQSSSMFTKILANWGTGAIPLFNYGTPLPLNPLPSQLKKPQLPVLFPNNRRAEFEVLCHSSTLHLGITHPYRSLSKPVTQEWLTNSQLANGNVHHE